MENEEISHSETSNKEVTSTKEFTIKAIIIGILIGIVFGAANAYLGLKVGLTVSASIPAAVMAVAIFRLLFKGGSILETNIVQTIGSAGESVAAGCVFTIPALFLLGVEPSKIEIAILAICGGLLGVIMMIPLRKSLIVKEHEQLPYPEGTACAEVLKSAQMDTSKAKPLFAGIGIGALYQALMHEKLFSLWNKEPSIKIRGIQGAELNAEVTPELLGVGYIIGPKISAIQLAGGLMAWFVLIPLFTWFGQYCNVPVAPAATLLKDMDAYDIWANYIRYIGAGGVAFAGIFSLIKSLPVIISCFKSGINNISNSNQIAEERTEQDISTKSIIKILAVLALIIVIYLYLNLFKGSITTSVITCLLVIVFSFFFVTVSSRIVGLLGSSANPISGMTIATLLLTCLIFIVTGLNALPNAKIAAITIGAFVCIASAIAGDTSQDLKTGYLVKSTPRYQQIGEIIGVITSGLVMGIVMYMLKDGIINKEFHAPQANLMHIVVNGVLGGNMPWALVILGAFMSLCVELLGINSLAFACGLYLPLSLSTSIMAGGFIRYLTDKNKEKPEYENMVERGTLYSSGLIAGASLLGVIMMIIAGFYPNFSGFIDSSKWVNKDLYAIIAFIVLLFTLIFVTKKKKD